MSKDNNTLVSISLKGRAYFLAVTLFIESAEGVPSNFDEKEFKRWMRVTRNLVENGAIDSNSAMVLCMQLLAKLFEKSIENKGDIYKTLAEWKENRSESQLGRQLMEEKEKAAKIKSGEAEGVDWESRIIDAESYSFFKGTIRFLYRGNIGGNTSKWDDFECKLKQAKELFTTNKISVDTMKIFLGYFKNFEGIKDRFVFTTIGYHPRNNCWKRNILTNEDEMIAGVIDSMLLSKPVPIHKDSGDDNYQAFLDSGLIEKIIGQSESFKYKYSSSHPHLIYRYYGQFEGVYISEQRKEKCEELNRLVEKGRIKLKDPEFNSYLNGYYWGRSVSFTYKEHTYKWIVDDEWTQKDMIYLYDNKVQSRNGVEWIGVGTLLEDIDRTDFNAIRHEDDKIGRPLLY